MPESVNGKSTFCSCAIFLTHLTPAAGSELGNTRQRINEKCQSILDSSRTAGHLGRTNKTDAKRTVIVARRAVSLATQDAKPFRRKPTLCSYVSRVVVLSWIEFSIGMAFEKTSGGVLSRLSLFCTS